ncbi:uncharacterized protein KQ657_004887 [Scheffersomyces spartinae]|uniref:Uncharacterized protein n=1 Tax=Scheffersomyces spartinae TaxID=45513 RepID=A0A9P7VAE3_9ASCO|nr:uncharacterized protein KQ657_004887 [Scheffersomyces spartinae]KAG7194178.1 hypothetical protein KQ657_004887 [Scheffersomyces spartinae]
MREQDLKDIFSILLIKLDLKEVPIETSSMTSFLRKREYPYLFSADRALQVMQDLDLVIDLKKARTVFKYDINNQLGLDFLSRFYDAKLLHCPTDRTRMELKLGLTVQPTPKGVAILVNFLSRSGIELTRWPSITFSSLNTMELFYFDRRGASDKILYSNYLLYLVFVRLMGNKLHIWSPRSAPQLVYYPCLANAGYLTDRLLSVSTDGEEVVEEDEDIFDGLGEGGLKIPKAEFHSYFHFGATEDSLDSSSSSSEGSKKTLNLLDSHSKPDPNKKQNQSNRTTIHGSFTVSPFHHRYFTNPESDSHIQYYVSNTGVRLFEDKWFQNEHGKTLKSNVCVSGKAICQWLCDCTDIMYPRQAGDVAELLVRAKLLKPISLPSTSSRERSKHVMDDRNALYCLTDFGMRTVQWQTTKLELEEVTDDFTSLALSLIIKGRPESTTKIVPKYVTETLKTLEDIMKDPGMRHLFKKHLEAEYCCENLDAYYELKRLEKAVQSLHKMINEELNSDKNTMWDVINAANQCLALAYRIYFIYIASDAPFTLNIGHDSRISIDKILVESKELPYLQTPVAEMHFDFDTMKVETPNKKEETVKSPARVHLKDQKFEPEFNDITDQITYRETATFYG